MKFAERVAAFMETHHYTPSQFGRAVMSDPNFVPRLLKGRQVTERVMDKVDAWMQAAPTRPSVANRPSTNARAVKARKARNGSVTKAERLGSTRTAPVVWTNKLDAAIIKLRNDGKTWGEVGAAIGVSRPTVCRRAIFLGLLPPPQPRP